MHFLGQHRLLLRNYQKLVLKTTFMAEVFQISSIFHIHAPLNHMPLVIKSKKKIDTHLFMNQSTRKRNGKTKRDVGSKS